MEDGLTKCNACGKDIAKSATQCPNCGNEKTSGATAYNIKFFIAMIISAAILFIIWMNVIR